MYLIINCPNCSKLMMANQINKTRQCPHCGNKTNLYGVKIIARAKSSQDAIEIIQKLKKSKAGKTWSLDFKTFGTKI